MIALGLCAAGVVLLTGEDLWAQILGVSLVAVAVLMQRAEDAPDEEDY